MARQRWMPKVLIGNIPFERLYPQERWNAILDYFEQAIAQEVSSGNTPRKYLAARQRFLQFFSDHVRSNPQLGIRDDQIPDIYLHVHDEFFGLGLIRVWLEDPEVEDILLDSWQRIDVIRGGVKYSYRSPFEDDEDVRSWMQRLLDKQGKQLSENNPMENGQLDDGSRIICLCQPVVQTCGFAIRKHRADRFQKEKYLASGVAPPAFFQELEQMVHNKLNILISGATGSGKTTFINYAGSLIPEDERILVIEDTRELMIPHMRVYQLTATQRGARHDRPDEQAITVRHLLAATLRMKPDRIIVGEVRGPEAFDMLNAMNTGHSGGLTTIHANSPAEAVLRLESLAAPAQENMPLWALQDLIATTLDVIIQMKQLPRSAQRRVVEAAQIFHPNQVIDRADLKPPTLKLRDNLYMRQLWLWNNQAGQLEQQSSLVRLHGHYFND